MAPSLSFLTCKGRTVILEAIGVINKIMAIAQVSREVSGAL